MFRGLVAGITVVALLGHALWGCCEHSHDTCPQAHFTVDHDALMTDCRGEQLASHHQHEHDEHGHSDHKTPACPSSGCDIIRCVYVGPDAPPVVELSAGTIWGGDVADVDVVVSPSVRHAHHLFEWDFSLPSQRRHALFQRWLI